MKDYYIVFASDCTATSSIEDYEPTLRNVQKYFGEVVTSEETYTPIEDVVVGGCSVLTDIGISEDYADIIVRVAIENVKLPIVDIAGYVSLTCPLPNGVDVIKDSLKTASEVDVPEVDIDVSYVGAPKYRIRVTAPDYKRAEGALRKVAEAAIKIVEKSEGVGKFHRDRV